MLEILIHMDRDIVHVAIAMEVITTQSDSEGIRFMVKGKGSLKPKCQEKNHQRRKVTPILGYDYEGCVCQHCL